MPDVEKWDERFDKRADATVVWEGRKCDRSREVCPADGGVMVRRLVDRARSLKVAILCIKNAARTTVNTYRMR
jgi:hypothetical protein